MIVRLSRSQFELVDGYWEYSLFVDGGWVDKGKSDDGSVYQGS